MHTKLKLKSLTQQKKTNILWTTTIALIVTNLTQIATRIFFEFCKMKSERHDACRWVLQERTRGLNLLYYQEPWPRGYLKPERDRHSLFSLKEYIGRSQVSYFLHHSLDSCWFYKGPYRLFGRAPSGMKLSPGHQSVAENFDDLLIVLLVISSCVFINT